MLIEDGDFSMGMLKDRWDSKPKITQVLGDINGPVYSRTEIDMSNSDFFDMNTPAIVKHNQQNTDVADWDFDSRFDGQAIITGDRNALPNRHLAQHLALWLAY